MNNDKTKAPLPDHHLQLNARAHADISGVRQVISFDENGVQLITECGELTLEGSDLKVGTLDIQRGVVSVDGRLTGIYYTDDAPRRRRGLFGRSRD